MKEHYPGEHPLQDREEMSETERALADGTRHVLVHLEGYSLPRYITYPSLEPTQLSADEEQELMQKLENSGEETIEAIRIATQRAQDKRNREMMRIFHMVEITCMVKTGRMPEESITNYENILLKEVLEEDGETSEWINPIIGLRSDIDVDDFVIKRRLKSIPRTSSSHTSPNHDSTFDFDIDADITDACRSIDINTLRENDDKNSKIEKISYIIRYLTVPSIMPRLAQEKFVREYTKDHFTLDEIANLLHFIDSRELWSKR